MTTEPYTVLDVSDRQTPEAFQGGRGATVGELRDALAGLDRRHRVWLTFDEEGTPRAAPLWTVQVSPIEKEVHFGC